MSLVKGFRHWVKRPSLLGLFNRSSDELYYNQHFFEPQVEGAVRYRQVQPQSLSPTDHLSETSTQRPFDILPQAFVQDSETVGMVSTSQDGDKTVNPQNSGTLTLAHAKMVDQAGPTVVDLLLDQAEGYVEQGLWDKAIAACKKAIAIDPQQASAHRLMGKTLHAMGQSLEAIGYYADALILQPQAAETYTELGFLYYYRQEWDKAITYYQKAIDLVSSSSRPESSAVLRAAQEGLLSAQVQAQQQADNTNQQVDAIYHSLSLSPETFTAEEHCEMGHLLLQQGDQDNAMVCFQRAIDCQPSCGTAHIQLAALMEQQQDWKNAMIHYKQVARIAQNTPELLLPLEIKTADEETQAEPEPQTFEPDPSVVMPPPTPTPLPQLTGHQDLSDPLVASVQAFVALARSYGEHGDVTKAVTHYRNALSLDPKNRDIHQELTLVLAQQPSKGPART